jgi:hypothetical protein
VRQPRGRYLANSASSLSSMVSSGVRCGCKRQSCDRRLRIRNVVGSPDRDRSIALLSTERLKGIAQLRIGSQEYPVVVVVVLPGYRRTQLGMSMGHSANGGRPPEADLTGRSSSLSFRLADPLDRIRGPAVLREGVSFRVVPSRTVMERRISRGKVGVKRHPKTAVGHFRGNSWSLKDWLAT